MTPDDLHLRGTVPLTTIALSDPGTVAKSAWLQETVTSAGSFGSAYPRFESRPVHPHHGPRAQSKQEWVQGHLVWQHTVDAAV